MSNAIGVVGEDGYTPIYQPDARWEMWSLHDIYRGGTGKNKFIPKVDDYVVEPESGLMYVVVSIDQVTMIPELALVTIKQSFANDELLSTTADNYRVYYDKSVKPYTLTVDGFMHTYSTTASFARIYRGTDIDPTKIISRRFDNNGNFVGHDIPMVMVSFNSHDNFGVKSVPGCNCEVELVDGEPCTVVVFDSNSKVVTKANCIIEETTFVAQAYAEQKYITQIFLKSVFIDATQHDIINFPVNLPVKSFNPIAVVQYNDGSQVEYPIDGDKFNLYGLDQFTSTILGHKVPLVLSYKMDANEAALANVNNDGFVVTRPYTLVVSQANRSYNVKMFVYPQWVDDVTGYTYKVYMTNLDRNVLYDITSVVSLGHNSPTFIPNAYGITQRLTFTVDLASVNSSFRSFVHVQTVDIVLRGRATDTSLPNIWEVGTQVPTDRPYYGTNLRATLHPATRRKLNIGNNLETLEDFLDKVYWATLPQFDPSTELEAPTPTHMEVRYLNKTVFVKVEDYKEDVLFDVDIPNYSTVEVIFYKETVGGYLKLSIASMTVR